MRDPRSCASATRISCSTRAHVLAKLCAIDVEKVPGPQWGDFKGHIWVWKSPHLNKSSKILLVCIWSQETTFCCSIYHQETRKAITTILCSSWMTDLLLLEQAVIAGQACRTPLVNCNPTAPKTGLLLPIMPTSYLISQLLSITTMLRAWEPPSAPSWGLSLT